MNYAEQFFAVCDTSYENAIDELSNLQDFPPSPLKSEEAQRLNYKKSLKEKFDTSKMQLRTAETIQLIQKDLSHVVGPELNKKFLDELELADKNFEAFLSTAEKQDPSLLTEDNFQQVFGFSNESMEALYALGCSYYSKKEFASAEEVFELLIYLCPGVASHWIANGLCQEQKNELQAALSVYSVALEMNPDNLQGAICYIRCLSKMGHKSEASVELDKIERQINENKELKEQWGKEISFLKQELS